MRPAVEGGLTAYEQTGTVTCPAGITRTLTRTRHAIFGAACHTAVSHLLGDLQGGRVVAAGGKHLLRCTPHMQDTLLGKGCGAQRPWIEGEPDPVGFRLNKPGQINAGAQRKDV